jgi:hypothetical protein
MDEELEGGVVFRLANIKNDFPPNAKKLQPAHLAIVDRDRHFAAQKNIPPSCSVFDVERCSVSQAKVIRPSDHEAIGFGLRVPEILTIRVGELPGLRVFRVPLDPPESELAGAVGHCGIVGLDRPVGRANGKNLFFALRTKLADLSFPLEDQR